MITIKLAESHGGSKFLRPNGPVVYPLRDAAPANRLMLGLRKPQCLPERLFASSW